ncbi:MULTISPECIES: sugar 3,4-ketoisomerase [unclassified Crossiella]|uniref:sugar 3,4-ketoisomerase n=1 Tax=unclassified Crossiella TaxID=2620835 RepID=UPI00207C3D1C|nr:MULTISPECIES: FdtA/QdtA family cupin domain-containing protein [unclassified Crossiella]MCO1574786.1 FdtA/QdtA family cupin domain-containing protein [Crossiella sp. SN42]WHT21638.1 FdtA/QdtA family cupin domain-containing protein [Crossiella sp. CA-258035]
MPAYKNEEGILVGKVEPCRMVDLPEHNDPRGNLCVVEAGKEIKFDIKRVYYLYDLPATTIRGAHGHRNLEQLIVAVHGKFDITVDDGEYRDRFHLDNPSRGLYVGPMVWRNLINFSPGAVGLVLASTHYDEADYYREYADFQRDARKL